MSLMAFSALPSVLQSQDGREGSKELRCQPFPTKRLTFVAPRHDMSAVILSRIPMSPQPKCNDDQAMGIMIAAPASMAFIK